MRILPVPAVISVKKGVNKRIRVEFVSRISRERAVASFGSRPANLTVIRVNVRTYFAESFPNAAGWKFDRRPVR